MTNANQTAPPNPSAGWGFPRGGRPNPAIQSHRRIFRHLIAVVKLFGLWSENSTKCPNWRGLQDFAFLIEVRRLLATATGRRRTRPEAWKSNGCLGEAFFPRVWMTLRHAGSLSF